MQNRDIAVFFSGTNVTYSIPIQNETERKIFGSSLNLTVNLDHPEVPYTLEHYGQCSLMGIYPDFTRRTYKTEISPQLNLNGCCEKK
tara:strand:+ start:343 stop:603 length:261 start_codon:yes stop_codon:yes gene_type:complete